MYVNFVHILLPTGINITGLVFKLTVQVPGRDNPNAFDGMVYIPSIICKIGNRLVVQFNSLQLKTLALVNCGALSTLTFQQQKYMAYKVC